MPGGGGGGAGSADAVAGARNDAARTAAPTPNLVTDFLTVFLLFVWLRGRIPADVSRTWLLVNPVQPPKPAAR
jgi:hypothetical protein